jgi:hypothetical protein
MALRDPIAIYNAANNLEAHFVRDTLVSAGIDAFVIEDVSQIGTWMFGLLPEIHKPQVWIERADIGRAKPVLEEYERQLAKRRDADFQPAPGSAILAVCEECGQQTSFPVRHRGSVQRCGHCGAYVDVGDEEGAVGWTEPIADDEAEEGP